jgi:ABC-type phosphate transport system ATPase subunit
VFQRIARVNHENGWAVEIGYDIPDNINGDTRLEIATEIVNIDEPDREIDPESVEYKQLQSIAEVLKVGFNIGCSYTTKVMEQAARMANKVMDEPANTNITGETNELIIDE